MSGPVGVLLDLLFPPKRVFCRRLLTSGEWDFCAHCQRELPWLEGPEVEQTGEFSTPYASPLACRGQIRDSVRRYRFKRWWGHHKTCGRLVVRCVHDHPDGRWDLTTWVPLSDQRRRERGYNQAFLLASAAVLELGEVVAETLRRGRNTEVQSDLDGDAAHRVNVLGAYTAVDAGLVEGKRVLLIDDVIITGTTISGCARILRTVEARGVTYATLARAKG